MDRTVPKTGSEDIELYIRTYYSLLRSTHPVQILTLVESHMNMDSSLHIHAREPLSDVSALVYALLRLPPQIVDVDLLVLGQSDEVFVSAGFEGVERWPRVSAKGRRRRIHYDGKNVFAVYIASRSDIDDLIPTLTAYQIEWNKLHRLFQSEILKIFLAHHEGRSDPLTDEELQVLADGLELSLQDVRRLQNAMGTRFIDTLTAMSQRPKHLSLQLLSGSVAHYRKATHRWWSHIEAQALNAGIDLTQRPVYFVSSNTHSLINLLTSFAPRHKAELYGMLQSHPQEGLLDEYEAVERAQAGRNQNNLLYYVLGKYLDEKYGDIKKSLRGDELESGVTRVPSERGFDVEAQVIEIRRLKPEWFDERLSAPYDYDLLAKSSALIFNIDYPLGMAAYEILNKVAYQVGSLLGVYIMGKAASLNGRIGDVMLPNVVHDEHSQNSYLIDNCIKARDVAPFLTYGTVLDNQKAISSRGTFLQNPRYMDVFYREGYTDIEMEAGPYLSAVYEAFRPKRHPYNEIVNLYGVPFDVGFVHYASDMPMSKGHNLGAGSLNYAGMDPTYGSAIAVLNRILNKEVRRMKQLEQRLARRVDIDAEIVQEEIATP